MKKLTILLAATATAQPALAASGPFFSLNNSDFVVLIAFIVFIGVLLFFKVPSMMGKMLDGRADGIKSDLDEAKKLREDAQTMLASYERKQKEVQGQADRIVETAKAEAAAAAEQAKADIKTSIERRLAAAEDQIASAEASAVKEIRDQAVTVAVGAANDIIAKQMTAKDGNALIEDAIAEVSTRLN